MNLIELVQSLHTHQLLCLFDYLDQDVDIIRTVLKELESREYDS